jgi:hypothetical protein
MKKRTINDKYEQNDFTVVAVKNKPVYKDEAIIGYEPTVSITVKVPFQKQMFEFANDDEIAYFIGTIDAEDPQQGLGL